MVNHKALRTMKKILILFLASILSLGSLSAKSKYKIQMIDIIHGQDFWQNGYVLYNVQTKDAILIDPGKVDNQIEDYIKSNNLNITAILNTHGHGDHVGGNAHYKTLYKVNVYAHIAEKRIHRTKNIITFFEEDQAPIIEGFKGLKFYHIPGHSPGSIAIHIEDILVTGDTLQKEGIGSTPNKTEEEDEKYTNMEINSIKTKLMILPDTTLVYPGHGYETSIGYERKNNEWLK